MRNQGDFFNVNDMGSASSSSNAPPTMPQRNNSSNAFGEINTTMLHQRKTSSGGGGAPTVMVSALPSHVRDRSGGSGPSASSSGSGGAPSIFSSQTLNSVSANAPGMQRQHSTGVGIAFDNSLVQQQQLQSPGSPYGVQTGTPGVNTTTTTSFEGRMPSGGGDFGSNNNTLSSSTGLLNEDDELPLLEELGIRPDHILGKAKLVLNPFSLNASHELCMDEDLAGPLTFALILGFLLTLQGKIHFGAIYGISVIGIVMSYFILTMMSSPAMQQNNNNQQQQQQDSQSSQPGVGGVRMTLVISTLGYCLLPELLLAAFATLHLWMFGRAAGAGFLLTILCFVMVVWSAWCAMKIFAEAFNLHHVKYLILYPAFLFYAVFAAIAMF